MYVKHFIKRVLAFTLIIGLGLLGLYIINRFYQSTHDGESLNIDEHF